MELTELVGSGVLWLLTVFCWSIIYEENKFSRIAEHVYLALAVGVVFNASLDTLRSNVLPYAVAGRVSFIVAILAGLLLYTRYFGKVAYLARYPMAIFMGTGLGLAVTGAINSQIVSQIAATIKISLTPDLAGLNSILILIMVITGMTYFTFSREHKGVLGVSAKMGRYVLMATMGTLIGGNFMLRIGTFLSVVKMLVEFPIRALGLIA